jgi:hypothetical protein
VSRLVDLLMEFPDDGDLDPGYEQELKMAVHRMWLNGVLDRRGHDRIGHIVR